MLMTVSLMVVAAVTMLIVLGANNFLVTDIWYRENPLVDPVSVISVHEGKITLRDGRVFRPAGVQRAKNVSPDEFDTALRVMCAQGVVLIRDLGDGSAFLLAEPKYYNPCGTRNHNGIPWQRSAGRYFQCPLSEFLIQSGYAVCDLNRPGLTARERWRLEGVEHIAGVDPEPRWIAVEIAAFRQGGDERSFEDYDATLELMWKPPPAP
ncbi:MAG: hypothetical protein K2X32_11810 [Phycisphaerales bacterium]|nr:hypothetical protein [Phycisphaerales bacterium]